MQIQVDGRATRWEEHNANRRRELVENTLRAIRRLGPSVGMDELAAQAGTSKPVLYRHFGDRAGLYRAVVESVHDFILRHLPLTDSPDLEPRELVHQLADAYLTLVQKDPEIYQFVVQRSAPSPEVDPVLGITTRIGNELSKALAAWLERNHLSTEPANTWGHGVVGFVYAVADRWIITNLNRPREEVVAYIDQLFEPAFAAQPRREP